MVNFQQTIASIFSKIWKRKPQKDSQQKVVRTRWNDSWPKQWIWKSTLILRMVWALAVLRCSRIKVLSRSTISKLTKIGYPPMKVKCSTEEASRIWRSRRMRMPNLVGSRCRRAGSLQRQRRARSCCPSECWRTRTAVSMERVEIGICRHTWSLRRRTRRVRCLNTIDAGRLNECFRRGQGILAPSRRWNHSKSRGRSSWAAGTRTRQHLRWPQRASPSHNKYQLVISCPSHKCWTSSLHQPSAARSQQLNKGNRCSPLPSHPFWTWRPTAWQTCTSNVRTCPLRECSRRGRSRVGKVQGDQRVQLHILHIWRRFKELEL